MGLDQSIFTTSKAVAQAIYEGNTPTGKWSTACFSPKNLEGKDKWTAFDTYAQSRLVQWGLEDSTTCGVPGLDSFGFAITFQDGTPSEERRNKTLGVIKYLGTKGTGTDGGDIPLYQVGLFQKFDALHQAIELAAGMEIESDGLAPISIDLLKMIRNSCQNAISKTADQDVPEWKTAQFKEFISFVDTLCSFPESEEALFVYNPWW